MINKSKFMLDISKKYNLDFQKLWQESILTKGEYNVKRALDDNVESKFWEKLASKYDCRETLYDYAPETFDKLLNIIGKNRTIIEIGCGTGKFTIPMSKYSKSILAIDFSKDMLSILDQKIKKNNITNINTKWMKWEDIKVNKVDVIFNVNAIYRMWNIREALLKMNKYGKERVVLVWTLQRSLFDSIFAEMGIFGIGANSDYIHIQNILYGLGIDANTEILRITRPVIYKSLEKIYDDFRKDSKNLILSDDKFVEILNRNIIKKNDHYIYNAKLKVAFIHWVPTIKCLY
ncbi:class I SAM-dependent methyltransferase [Maledivibacter halophilus]|uniref:SAM-dependent methyltransferases related to tRNA (Uracil-5-)-methyltransferase n=1 Tax=Maledivibacter halophilus TaxID=36842 RepID=A0A1T5LZR5_9FIRM|nr:class I SAM-dependent methyltransferase [Maledivibacter halophilus]SKC81462.1 SAM-dependent methyltransferases related to tRNA (uracil-5-)-methyltransferase [Maledivibacter halophilus]